MINENDKKNKRFSKYVIFIAAGLLGLLLLLRLISTTQNTEAGLAPVNIPEQDVKLPEKESKIQQFEQDDKSKEDAERHKTDNPYTIENNFKTVTNTTNTTVQTNTTSVPTEKNRSENTYSNVGTRNEKPTTANYEASHEKIVIQPEPVPQKKSPFGTIYSSNGNNSTTSTVSVPKDLYKAVIHADQTIGNGQAAIFRNVEEIFLPDGTTLPKNSILYGQASYSGDRVKIEINRALTGNKVSVVVYLDVYDNDYIEGVFFKTAIDKGADQAKDNTVSQGISGAPITTPAGAAGYGIGLMKSAINTAQQAAIANRKLKLEEGYIVYLKPTKRK